MNISPALRMANQEPMEFPDKIPNLAKFLVVVEVDRPRFAFQVRKLAYKLHEHTLILSVRFQILSIKYVF